MECNSAILSVGELSNIRLEGFIVDIELEVNHFKEGGFDFIEFFFLDTSDFSVVIVLQGLVVVVFNRDDG